MDTDTSNNIRLSYLVVTKNKLPYLKDRLNKLLQVVKNDEEILIADGLSTDGTIEYLQTLKNDGKISYLLSENDAGVAHALNKIVLKAKGILVRFITDDDVFHYPTIESCKNFMLLHSEIDILFTDGGIKDQNPPKPIKTLLYHKNFEKWLIDKKPFTATDLGVMFRKSSIPLIGIWNTSFPSPDAEFVFRVMASKAEIAWCNGFTFVNVSNKKSVSLSSMKKISEDMDRLNKFYLNKNPDSFIIKKFKILKNKIRSHFVYNKKLNDSNTISTDPMKNWQKLIEISENWLDEQYHNTKPSFIYERKS